MSSHAREALFFNGFYIEVYRRVKKYIDKARKNPRWFLMSIAGRFRYIRSRIVKSAKKSDISQYRSQSQKTHFPDIQANNIAQTLKRDGLCLGLSLPAKTTQEILDFAYSNQCYANLDSRLGFLYPNKETISPNRTVFTAQYFNTSLKCSAIRALGQDPKLLEIAALYLGADPIFTGSRLWWNFAVEDDSPYDSNKTITFFHYDLDDYACLRFFFYLTDVGEESGPHVCVRGSHVKKHLFHIFWPVKRRQDKQILAYYGTENVVRVLGGKGSGFAEDTFCYHKATRPLKHDRLMLQIQFALHDYGLHNDFKNV